MADPENNRPNLDLINMVQAARMQHDAQAQPSQIHNAYWIEAKRQTDSPPPTPGGGQWLIYATLAEVDELWARIRAVTEEGRLGYKSKVSTVSRDKARGSGDRVICVRTAEDAADVERIRLALRALGVTGELVYQRD